MPVRNSPYKFNSKYKKQPWFKWTYGNNVLEKNKRGVPKNEAGNIKEYCHDFLKNHYHLIKKDGEEVCFVKHRSLENLF